MATKPTRMQQQAGDRLAEALLLVAEAGRLDGGGRLDRDAFRDLARRIAGVSSALDPEAIVSRALERRARALGLPDGSVELLTLMESAVTPPDALTLPDDDLRALVARLEEELG